MVPYWVVFCDIIHQVFPSLFPEYAEMIFSYPVSDPIKPHVYSSGYVFPVQFTMMFSALLSISTGVGGCEWPIYAKAVCMDVTFWKFSNIPPNSFSVY